MSLPRINLLLALTAAVLAALVVLPARFDAPARLTQLPADAIGHIRLERRDGDTLVFQRRGGHWYMTEPTPGRADPEKLAEIARMAEVPTARCFPADTTRSAEWGLAPPSVRVRLNAATLEMGSNEPIRGRRYVRRDATVCLIDDRFHHLLTASAQNLAPPARP